MVLLSPSLPDSWLHTRATILLIGSIEINYLATKPDCRRRVQLLLFILYTASHFSFQFFVATKSNRKGHLSARVPTIANNNIELVFKTNIYSCFLYFFFFIESPFQIESGEDEKLAETSHSRRLSNKLRNNYRKNTEILANIKEKRSLEAGGNDKQYGKLI